jgi:predicted ribonuclease YlaK
MTMTLFVDTNFFLQLRDIASLPWAEISEEEDLCVLIPRTVQDEIDRLKQDGSGRRSRRARKASSFLREVIKADAQTLVIRESNPRVLVSFPPISGPNNARPVTLDPTRADDQIVGEVLDYARSHPSEFFF